MGQSQVAWWSELLESLGGGPSSEWGGIRSQWKPHDRADGDTVGLAVIGTGGVALPNAWRRVCPSQQQTIRGL